MPALFGFVPPDPTAHADGGAREALAWISAHCWKLAQSHMALAEKAEGLMEQFLDNRRFRSGLRTSARHHRRAAWKHLEMVHRAESARRGGHLDFDLAQEMPAS
jgi:hypothetical protein